MPTTFSIGGTDASTYGVYISGEVDGWLDAPEMAIPEAQLAGWYGTVLSRYASVGSRVIRVPIRVIGTTVAARELNEQTLKANLNQSVAVILDDGSTARTITGRLRQVALRPFKRVTTTVSEGSLSFVCSSPFWKATSDTTETINGTPNALALGNAPVTSWVLTITATTNSITDVTITLGASTLTWTGTIAAGQALVIDSNDFTVENNAVDALATYSGGFPALDPAATPSVSAVKGSGSGTLGGSLVYRKAYW